MVCSAGSRAVSARSTVSPPTPLSKTPMGASIASGCLRELPGERNLPGGGGLVGHREQDVRLEGSRGGVDAPQAGGGRARYRDAGGSAIRAAGSLRTRRV